MSKAKIRWGDTLDDEDALPPTTIRGPDSHGVKTITEYYRNDKGETFKKTTKLKVVNVEKKVYKVGAWQSDAFYQQHEGCHALPSAGHPFACSFIRARPLNATSMISRSRTVPLLILCDGRLWQVTAERRAWPRFGEALKETPEDSVTVQHVEDIPFDRVRQTKATSQEKKITDMQQVLAQGDKSTIVGR